MSVPALNPSAPAPRIEPFPPAPLAENDNQRARINSISDRVFYNIYSFFNPAPLIPKRTFYFVEPREDDFDRAIPKPYKDVRARILAMTPEDLLGPGIVAAKAQLDIYADPVFRLARAREQYEMALAGRSIEYERNKIRSYCVGLLCDQELHDLFKNEYKKRFRNELHYGNQRWIYDMGLSVDKDDNKIILTQHKQEWDGLTVAERVKKICFKGQASRYLTAALGTASVASLFFLAKPR